ncbi:MAG TPA: SpoIIE family protein phosphatase, partial [Polyangiaceae bacterium]
QILNAIGMNPTVDTDCTYVELFDGDRLVLCTDGVHEMIGDEAEIAALAKSGRPSDAAQALVEAALDRGGRDNATALVIAVREARSTREARVPTGSGRDLKTVRSCPLLVDLPEALVLRTLTLGVEVEIDADKTIPRIVTADHVAYVVLEGEVDLGELRLGPSALLYGESLLRSGRGLPRFHAATPVRAFRLRADDFREVCATDTRFAAALYERLARHLASLQRS